MSSASSLIPLLACGSLMGPRLHSSNRQNRIENFFPVSFRSTIRKCKRRLHHSMMQWKRARAVFESFQRSFRLPEHSEAARLAREFAASHDKVMSVARDLVAPIGTTRFDDLLCSNTELEKAMQSMRTPWLYRDNPLLSAHAFGELFALGRAVNTIAPFDDKLGEALRRALGDWREIGELPRPIFENPVTRSRFYYEAGFNASLTEFTPEAFDEGMSLAGLPVQQDDSELNEETALSRNERSYGQLLRFERQLRRFVDRMMIKAFGSEWMKQQTPAGMIDSWKEKRQIGMDKAEEEKPLMQYADFTDYIRIIERNDNWKEVFAPIFHRREDVRESFTRLFPVRICTMHARIITLDDELLLRLEIQRIRRAISRY